MSQVDPSNQVDSTHMTKYGSSNMVRHDLTHVAKYN